MRSNSDILVQQENFPTKVKKTDQQNCPPINVGSKGHSQLFTTPSLKDNHSINSLSPKLSPKSLQSSREEKERRVTEREREMVEHQLLGLLKVKVVRGVNLAIRDMMKRSSDPYLILKLGKHKVKTHVKRRTINPEWNEELTLSVEDPNVPLKLKLFDKDLLSLDDPMGHAEIDLKPLIEVVKQDLSNKINGTIIKTIIPNRQNCFAETSNIYWSEGNVVQDMVIHLKDVERGDIEMRLTWGKVKGAKV
ncbi:hypothetical protein LUZ60_012695 [Juncus effusus]|nr:hypothetical protein LUZ60_012695 [Juncus effusus]